MHSNYSSTKETKKKIHDLEIEKNMLQQEAQKNPNNHDFDAYIVAIESEIKKLETQQDEHSPTM